MRGAAAVWSRLWNIASISTHAPHARRGGPFSVHHRQIRHFYSRASCEARPNHHEDKTHQKIFLLTRLMRGAAFKRSSQREAKDNFYSRASCEARPETALNNLETELFLLTRLMRGAAKHCKYSNKRFHISTHAPHARRGDQ